MKIEGKWSYTDNVHIADSLNLQGGVASAYTSLTIMGLCQKFLRANNTHYWGHQFTMLTLIETSATARTFI